MLGFRQRTGSFGLWFCDAADWVARRNDHHCFGVGGSKLTADWVARRNDRSRGWFGLEEGRRPDGVVKWVLDSARGVVSQTDRGSAGL